MANCVSSWNDRIPFVLLFGIATSVDMFLDNISQATVKRLHCGIFNVVQLEIEEIFKAASSLDAPVGPWLGPSLSSAILQRQKDYLQNISAFTQTLNASLLFLVQRHYANDMPIVRSHDTFFCEPAYHIFEPRRSM